MKDGCLNVLFILLILAVIVLIGYLLREWILIGFIALLVIAAIYNAAS